MAQNKKSGSNNQKIKLIILIAILLGTVCLFLFVTLPSMGINIFGGGNSTSSSTSSPGNTVVPVTSSNINNINGNSVSNPLSGSTSVDKNLLGNVLDNLKKIKEYYSYNEEVFSPYYLKIENKEEVGNLLTSEEEGITNFEAANFISYFKDENGDKKAWIRMKSQGDKVYELKVNSYIPFYPDMQVLDINNIGILIYKYPKLSSETEKGIGPKLYRIVADPYKVTGINF